MFQASRNSFKQYNTYRLVQNTNVQVCLNFITSLNINQISKFFHQHIHHWTFKIPSDLKCIITLHDKMLVPAFNVTLVHVT